MRLPQVCHAIAPKPPVEEAAFNDSSPRICVMRYGWGLALHFGPNRQEGSPLPMFRRRPQQERPGNPRQARLRDARARPQPAPLQTAASLAMLSGAAG
jgi:hypothetical protein